MIKLLKKLVNWCFEPQIITDEIQDNKFYIPCSQVFCYEKKQKVKAKTK